MKKTVCIVASAFLLSLQGRAQLVCGTDALYNKLRAENPAISDVEAKLNIAIKEAIEREKAAGSPLFKTTATTYDVPIVIHVIHDYGAEYLSDDVIFDAVAYWDKVYNKENADTADVINSFKKYIGNPQIRLHLATKDPSGNPTKGITRRQSYLTMRGGDNAKMDDWPNNKYINIWFINKFDASHSGAAAYAYYPSSGAFMPFYDGIISQASYVNTDKTIPHELGHVLNLQHTWGNTNNPGVACGDDQVEDTPPTYGHTSCLASDLYDTRCATGYTDGSGVYHPNSTLAPDTSNTQNVMEYAYCSKMFTHGQVDRMRAALTSSVAGRNNLFTSANLAATGALAARPDLAPTPDFSVERGVLSWGGYAAERTYFLCQDAATQFSFMNRSWNDTVTSVSWSFSNNPYTSTASLISTTVENKFKDAGWVTVTLSATGNNSGTSTINRKAVYVASNNAKAIGYNQYFTDEPSYTDWPMFNYYNNNFRWEHNANNGFPNGSGCVRYRSFDARSTPESYSGTPGGDYDDIFTPAFDFSTMPGTSAANLNFYTAGCATSNTDYSDSMQIFASTNCGESWVRIASLNFGALINNSFREDEFAPTMASQWKAQTVNIPSSQRTNKTFFRFRYWPGKGGNNLYFDNFTISPWTTELKDVAQNKNEVKLIPNPASSSTKLCFTTDASGESAYIVRDVTGKIIAQKTLHNQPNTFTQEELDRTMFPAAGIYLVTLTQSQQTITQKLVIE